MYLQLQYFCALCVRVKFLLLTFKQIWLCVCVCVCVCVCCPALRDKARELNATLGSRDGAPEKSVNEMNDEIQAMLAELRKRQLSGKKSIADEELG